MSSIINASNTGFGGVITTGDSSGQLQLQTAGTTAVTLDTSQNATFAGKVTSAGALTLASNGSTTAVTIDTSQNVMINVSSPIAGTGKFNVVQSTASNWTAFFQGANAYGCIGITNTSGTASYNALNFYNNGTSFSSTGTISVSGTTTAYNTSSDYRLKENILPMTNALEKVAQLKPVTYIWKQDGSNGEGFIAHELAEVCPQAVAGKKDAVDSEGKPIYQGIDTSFLVATLTAAIQEQQTIINDLKARIETLEGAKIG